MEKSSLKFIFQNDNLDEPVCDFRFECMSLELMEKFYVLINWCPDCNLDNIKEHFFMTFKCWPCSYSWAFFLGYDCK